MTPDLNELARKWKRWDAPRSHETAKHTRDIFESHDGEYVLYDDALATIKQAVEQGESTSNVGLCLKIDELRDLRAELARVKAQNEQLREVIDKAYDYADYRKNYSLQCKALAKILAEAQKEEEAKESAHEAGGS